MENQGSAGISCSGFKKKYPVDFHIVVSCKATDNTEETNMNSLLNYFTQSLFAGDGEANFLGGRVY
jgi:hypothetical protein